MKHNVQVYLLSTTAANKTLFKNKTEKPTFASLRDTIIDWVETETVQSYTKRYIKQM